MRSYTIQWSVLFLFLTCCMASAQEASQDETVRMLIEQLSDVNFKTREAAEKRLIEIGPPAVTLLRSAAKSDDAEVSLRARNALRQITTLSPEDQERLRAGGQVAFYAGDYREMVGIYRRLNRAADASIDDGRWLGHAYQLGSQWKEAAIAYATVIDRMDQLLDKKPEEVALPRPGDPFGPDKNKNRNILQHRAATILLTARIQRLYLKDPVGAQRTLQRIYQFNDVLNEPLDVIAKKWRARIAEALQTEKGNPGAKLDHQRSMSLRFPLMALRELAAVQQLNGKYAEALASWGRIHWITREYVGNGESLDSLAMHQLIQALPAVAADAVPAVTILDPINPTSEFNLSDPAALAKAYDYQNHYWSFALAPPRGYEFQSLEFTCDIEQFELRYGGQLSCWTWAGEPATRKGIGGVSWHGKPPGRDKVTAKYPIEPGAGLVHFQTGLWKDKFKVHGVTVSAVLRPVGSAGNPDEKPVAGFVLSTDIQPKGGSLTLNQQPLSNESTSHDIKPGRYALEYAHPRLPQPRRYSLDFQSGGIYGLYVNLDSPLTSQLTNLRGFESHYGPSTNIVKLPDGRWLVAWCHGGLRFATSSDGVTWSEPVETSDADLFNANYNTLTPTLFVDKQGTIWVAYFSNQLDIDQLNTGGYRLLLRSSKDGREWSAARPVNMPVQGFPPGKVQLLYGPNEKVWMLYRMQYAEADSPAEFAEFKNLDIPLTEIQRSHAMNPQATIDAAGRIHLVWDHFSQTLYYSRRDPDGTWCEPIEIPGKEQSPRRSHPYLIIRDNRVALIHDANQSAFLRRGEFKDGVPTFGEPIKITSHTAPLIGTFPLTPPADRILILCGSNTVWTHAVSIEELFNSRKD